MSGIKNKMSLTLDSSVWLKDPNFRSLLTDNAQPKIHKKYLGESSDPHFVPASPLISRQWLSEQEEGELSRTCALALARVPHSDDMSDDPFQYIAPQITAKPPPTEKSQTLPASLPVVPPIPVEADTATPSDGSKRDTMDRTDYSTPMTSAGVTPGETTKRFSDAARRASSSKGSSNLKYEKAQSKKSRTASSVQTMPRKSNDTSMRKSHEVRKPSGDYNPVEHTLRLVPDYARHSESLPRPDFIVQPARYSQQDLNKRLPPLPRTATEPPPRTPIARIMKTIKRKKSEVIEGRSASVSAFSTPPLPSTKPDTPKLRQKSMPPAPRIPIMPAVESKRRFRIPFFSNRRDRPQQPVLVS